MDIHSELDNLLELSFIDGVVDAECWTDFIIKCIEHRYGTEWRVVSKMLKDARKEKD